MTRGRAASLGQGPADLQADSHQGPSTGHRCARCHARGWGRWMWMSITTHCGRDCERMAISAGVRLRVKNWSKESLHLLNLWPIYHNPQTFHTLRIVLYLSLFLNRHTYKQTFGTRFPHDELQSNIHATHYNSCFRHSR